MNRERFVLPEEGTFDYLYERREAANLGNYQHRIRKN